MNIGFILNGEDVSIDTDAESRLVDILRNTFGLLGAKTGCYIGNCGACSVILNGEVVKACLVPAFKIRAREIVTVEGFMQTDEYQDVLDAVAETEAENCGFCNAGKILTAEALLGRNPRPSEDEILSAFQGIRCRCTDPEELVQLVTALAKHRRRRIYGRS